MAILAVVANDEKLDKVQRAFSLDQSMRNVINKITAKEIIIITYETRS